MKMLNTIGMFALVTLGACGNADHLPAQTAVTPSTPTTTPTPSAPSPAGPITITKVPLLDATHRTHFSELPLEATVEISKRLWSGDHWAFNKGIINRRWNTPTQEGFNTISPTKEELVLMSQEEIARLAPSEKYDLFMGNYDYPLKKQVTEKANPLAVYWEGIGNGWASASSNHDEPTPKLFINPDGLSIPFGSSDIKALLSYYYAFASTLPLSVHLGVRCLERQDTNADQDKCGDDLSPASFHIALTNKIGLRKESFLADLDRYHEVWNHPIQAYKSEVLGTGPASENAPADAKETIRIKTRISYVDESVGNSWDPIKGTYRQVTSGRIYHYDLHLNGSGEILGGEWKSNDHPDFIWVMPPVEVFEGYFANLVQLLN